MNNSSNGNSGKTSGGIGFFGVLQLILITLVVSSSPYLDWTWTYGNSHCNHRDRSTFEVGGRDIDTGTDEKPQYNRRNVWKRCTGGYGD